MAALCPACDTSLPAAWLTCAHENTVETSCLGERRGRTLCNGCGVTYWCGDTQAQAEQPVPTEDEWAVGDRVLVRPITVRVNGGPAQSGYLVVRDPDGDARVSAVTYDDEPPGRTTTFVLDGDVPSPTGTRAWVEPQSDCPSRLTQGWPLIDRSAHPGEGRQ